MTFESIVSIFLASTIIIVVVVICVRNINPKRKLIRFVTKDCLHQVAVLLDKDIIQENHSYTKEEIEKITKLSFEDWKHWLEQVRLAKSISKKYPTAFGDYLQEYFPQVRKRKNVENRWLRAKSSKNEVLIDGMLSNELSFVLSESDENWNNRIRISSEAKRIIYANRDGYKTYCEIKKTDSPVSIDVLRDKKAIEEYQVAFEISKNYDGWEDRQKEFCSNYYEICKEHRDCDGRFTYQVKFSHIDKYCKHVESEFKIWQGFVGSFSFEHEALLPEHMLRNKNNLPAWKIRERYYYKRVYDALFNVIEGITEKQGSKPLIVFVFSSRYEWEKETYNYHYRHLRESLTSNDYTITELESINTIKKDEIFDSVVLIDLITHNEDLKINSRIIAEYFTSKQPFIAYYSLLKEYSEEEVLRFYKNKKIEIIEQKKMQELQEIEFVKNLILKVNKHSYFSYTAITNTLIGRAGGANAIKKVWLDDPSKYHFKMEDSTGVMIKGSYSLDNELNYIEFNMSGSKTSVDDVSKYTYKLFLEMGIWNQFKSKGEDAINRMNSMGLLSTH